MLRSIDGRGTFHLKRQHERRATAGLLVRIFSTSRGILPILVNQHKGFARVAKDGAKKYSGVSVDKAGFSVLDARHLSFMAVNNEVDSGAVTLAPSTKFNDPSPSCKEVILEAMPTLTFPLSSAS